MMTLNAALRFAPYLFFFLNTVDAQKPPNDECTNATVIPSAPASYPYITDLNNYFRATTNPNDPKPPCFVDFDPSFPDYTVWFQWTPNATGVFTFNTLGSVVDPTLPRDDPFNAFPESYIAIFKGSNCGSLELIACSNAYLTNIALQANQSYFIFISELDHRTAFDNLPGSLRLTVTPTPPAPPNDECATAIFASSEIFLFSTVFAVDIDRATQNNTADKTCQLEKGDSVWALWTPAFSGAFDFRTNASKSIYNDSFIMQVAIYEGNSCETAKQVACNFGSIDGFSVRTGTSYYIKVQAEDVKDNNGGTVQLDIYQSTVAVEPPGFFRRLILLIRLLWFQLFGI